ncbi:MAG: hypothetical protein M1817_006380 [Caeruleum heppii]|nr:MAG: hypothetical protein M1817_006380 [Caeruleum heppii]
MTMLGAPSHLLIVLAAAWTIFTGSVQAGVMTQSYAHLRPRKNVDPNLFCWANKPPREQWPAGAPPWASFDTLTDMCALIFRGTSVGCLCDMPYNNVECRRELANPVLFERFHEYCIDNCMCKRRQDEEPEVESDDADDVPMVNFGSPDDTDVDDHLPNTPDLEPTSRATGHGGYDRPDWTPAGSADGAWEASRNPPPVAPPKTCSSSCTAVTQQCGQDCRCTARPIGSPHGNIFHFFGACAAVHHRPLSQLSIPAGRRRDLNATAASDSDSGGGRHLVNGTSGFFEESGAQVPCPCNTSYVSYGCCHSDSGIVFEPPEMKLGELHFA